MHRLRIVPVALGSSVLLAVLLTVSACTTTVDGSGTRIAGSATDFPSTPTGDPSSSPTDSPTGGDTDASDLVDQMVETMTTRPQGFTMKGKFDADDDIATIDLRMATDSGQGTITIGTDECDLVNDAGDGYALAPTAFWTDDIGLDDDVAAQMNGKWVKMSGDLLALKTFVDAETFFHALSSSSDDYTLGAATTKQGVDVQTVDGDDSTFYISSDEPHVLIELDDDDGPLAFGFPDDDLSVTAPANSIPYPG